MNFIFKNIIAIISIIPIGLIFYLNNIAIYEINFFIIGIMLFLPILLTSISIYGMKYFDQEIISNINEISCIDYKILLMYIGYMILAFNNIYVVSFIFGLIYIFSYITKLYYFNPFLWIFGFHFYDVKSINGTNVYIIAKGNIIKNCIDFNQKRIYRIDDHVFIMFN